MDRTLMVEGFLPRNDSKSCGRKHWRSISGTVMESEKEQDGGSNSSSGIGFECNICLDSVHDPVVTLCGHLYCWPCIYQWLNSPSDDDYYSDMPSRRHCPVCKWEISESAVVPLFSHGQTSDDVAVQSGVPRRPPPRRASRLRNPSPPPMRHGYYWGQPGGRGVELDLSGRVSIPIVGMLGEIVFAGSFGYTTPYHQLAEGGGNPRVRRQMMLADKSLSRVCFFLVCCVMMCIVLF